LSHSYAGAVRDVVTAFRIEGRPVRIEPFERGHIHDTFVSTWDRNGVVSRFLHQRINDRVFRDVAALMNNIDRVTRHLAARRAAFGLRTLELVATRDDRVFLEHDTGCWRTYRFVEGTHSYDLCESPAQARAAARAFGDFQARVSDLDVRGLRETIPDFFSSPHRLAQFDRALRTDVAHRAAQVGSEIAFVDERRALFDVIEAALADGSVPRRIVHGDTKLNNVLFDTRTGAAVCVVDLDTCMPGWTLYDFGDLVRFTAATSVEDERDLRRAGMDFELYRAIVEGYLEAAGWFLTGAEFALMPVAARLVTLTIGVRFLTDHLEGDRYFKVHREGHNLDRARVQFAMVEAMERRESEMAAVVDEVSARLRKAERRSTHR